jgi:hypothetical protein
MAAPTQLTREHLESMSPSQIEAARLRGELEVLQGRPAPLDLDAATGKQLTDADIRELFAAKRFDDIEAARKAGLCNDLLSGKLSGKGRRID